MDYERFKEGFQDALKAELAVRGADVELTARRVDKMNDSYDAILTDRFIRVENCCYQLMMKKRKNIIRLKMAGWILLILLTSDSDQTEIGDVHRYSRNIQNLMT